MLSDVRRRGHALLHHRMAQTLKLRTQPNRSTPKASAGLIAQPALFVFLRRSCQGGGSKATASSDSAAVQQGCRRHEGRQVLPQLGAFRKIIEQGTQAPDSYGCDTFMVIQQNGFGSAKHLIPFFFTENSSHFE